jgi:hypothetical protein
MKKFTIGLVMLVLALGVSFAYAADVTKTLTFQWTQEDTTNLKEWKLFWSDTSGGPYTEIAIFPYDPNVTGPVYSSSESATVTGEQGTTVTKFFVLIACGDIPQAGGTTNYLCSADSNEVSHGFWIPAGQFSVPVNFNIVPAP